ncbi:A4_beta-galactosidase_middle_domain domain containing protein [Paracoccaceae bacterium]
MSRTVIFDPLVPLPLIWALAAVAVVLLAFAIWRGLRGWPLRGLAMLALGLALVNPSLQEENRKPLSDIILAVVDDSASQRLSDRPAQTEAALASLSAAVAALENTELRVIRFADGAKDAGSLAMTALAEVIAAEPRARIAGAVIITDGQVHDAGLAPSLPAPLHVLLTGRATDWDRRLVITDAPAFAIIGEEFTLKLRIEDQGAAPALGPEAEITIAVDAEDPVTFSVPVNTDLELPVTLPHGGQNVLHFSLAPVEGELTDRNNAAVVQINGVRDRLRVLLVSGEPHAGERVWRNLLKSDAAVDLVHFTILRPPEKQDGVPVDELALIAFPTRELFVEKIDEFDLIIFDRYRMRGILPMEYIDNVVSYVRGGGTVLVAAGPEFGAVDSLWRSPLAEILPVAPTAQVIEEPFRPALTELGRRHPVTEGLEALAPEGGWGRWFRLAEVELLRGQVAMSGPGDRPLLVLDRVDEGRIAVLASDHAWLWGRGFEGGGPQLELMKRLAHWMLKEPELEEEALMAASNGDVLTLTRRTIKEEPPGVLTITAPDGTVTELNLAQLSPGRFQIDWQAPMVGLYRLEQDDLTRVVAVGPSAPREFVETLASPVLLQPVVDTVQGGMPRLEEGFPALRAVREGRPAAGRGWLGYTPRGAYVTEDLRISPLVPGWLVLLLAAGLAVAAWLAEGRRRITAG